MAVTINGYRHFFGSSGADIVGLPNQAVKESRERVQAAIKNSGLP